MESIDLCKRFPQTNCMGALNLSLADRTAVISGPLGPMMQNLASTLTENGADVAMLVSSEQLSMAQRFCQNLMDLREISERYGRSAAVESSFEDESSARDAFGRSAEIFGTTDIYIDTHLAHLNFPIGKKTELKEADAKFSECFRRSRITTDVALAFIRNRSKSRVLYVANQLDLFELNRMGSTKAAEMKEYVANLALETIKDHVTVNALALGISEDYLLSRGISGGASIQKELKSLQELLPGARLVDYLDISAMISFIVSPLSTALNGQTIYLNHGLKIPT